MPHVILLGDSIFDNGAYVPGENDVVAQLRAELGAGWRASLRAVDGGLTRDVAWQLDRVPADATHLVVSAGGNDALNAAGILEAPALSAAETIGQLADLHESFAADYDAMLAGVLDRRLPTTVCTIYDGNFGNPALQRLASAALTVFNDVILRHATRRRLAVIDLRALCREPEDYANAIEPSAVGGRKIARAIARVVESHDFGAAAASIYV
jgi:lysophospholipase L1-like esterase